MDSFHSLVKISQLFCFDIPFKCMGMYMTLDLTHSPISIGIIVHIVNKSIHEY